MVRIAFGMIPFLCEGFESCWTHENLDAMKQFQNCSQAAKQLPEKICWNGQLKMKARSL